MSRGDVSAVSDWAPPQLLDALQKLCHDMLAQSAGGVPRFFDVQHLPKPVRLTALSAWSRELMKAARTVEHPFNPGLMLEALVSQARNVLNSAG